MNTEVHAVLKEDVLFLLRNRAKLSIPGDFLELEANGFSALIGSYRAG